MFKKLFTAILGLFFFLSLTSFASAQTPLPPGGTTFDNAVPIQAGKYILPAETEGGFYQFYTIPLEAGQNLRVEITTASDGYGMAAIYDVYKKKLAEDRVISEVNAVRDIAIRAERKGNYFITIGSESGESTGNLYQISYETKTPDPNTETSSGTSLPPSVSDLTTALKTGSTLSKAQSLRMPLVILLTIVAVVIVAILLLKKKPAGSKTSERKTEESKESKSESGSVFCSKCGAKNSKEAEFCSKCGAKLSK